MGKPLKNKNASLHICSDIDDFQFQNECPDNEEKSNLFSVWKEGIHNDKYFDDKGIFFKADVKSAVDFLKKKIVACGNLKYKESCEDGTLKTTRSLANMNIVLEYIDEAFPDVMEKK